MTATSAPGTMEEPPEPVACSLRELALYFFTLGVLLRFRRVQEPLVIVAAGVAGFFIKGGLLE